jgi:hypothetical protein
MAWKRVIVVFLITLAVKVIAQDKRSFRMSVMKGWQFQCANTTCLPYIVTILPNIRQCQTSCLAQMPCKAVTFHQSISTCKLFVDIPYQNGSMVTNTDTITMIAMPETRIPPGQYPSKCFHLNRIFPSLK